jgi:putative endonuclease
VSDLGGVGPFGFGQVNGGEVENNEEKEWK